MPTQEELQSIKDLIQKYALGGLTKQAEQLQAYYDSLVKGDYKGAQGVIAGSDFLSQNAEQEKWLDNMVASQNTEEAREWEQFMRDSSTLSQASQLSQLGLSSSGVLTTGGAVHSGVAAADNVKSNLAMQRHQQKMALAKQLLSMTSSMASAGIYGHALGAAKKASSVVTNAASHSAYQALRDKPSNAKQSAEWDKMVKYLESENHDPEYGEDYNPGFGYL